MQNHKTVESYRAEVIDRFVGDFLIFARFYHAECEDAKREGRRTPERTWLHKMNVVYSLAEDIDIWADVAWRVEHKMDFYNKTIANLLAHVK